MSALTAVGGIAGFLRARSVPSLVGGLLVSGLYATGVGVILIAQVARKTDIDAIQGNLIAQNDDRGLATALGRWRWHDDLINKTFSKP
ncbi:hypothetical protein EMMF5_000761 [Cystobasidiomycetes sp. EMM_F5]